VHEGGSYAIGDGGPGVVTMKLRATLLNIQQGTAPDTHGWMQRLA
jgi:branched-chain amino acid aminotransferase